MSCFYAFRPGLQNSSPPQDCYHGIQFGKPQLGNDAEHPIWEARTDDTLSHGTTSEYLSAGAKGDGVSCFSALQPGLQNIVVQRYQGI